MAERVQQHEAIRNDLLKIFRACPGCSVRTTEAGSYVFVTVPELEVTMLQFIKLLRTQAAVTVTPGIEFGPQFTMSFRMNFSQDHKAAVAAANRIATMIERYRI